ncbi:MAG: hypothetical protein FD166_2978 [Bacteroidetes bacterium]|nr:MAG: hypothetical protein FD166_2978 [Bacteroidota bacterium]
MRLKTEIIERINGRADIKRSLLELFDISRGSMWRFLKENEDNGPLTTYKALLIISEGLGISPEEALIEAKEQEAV